MSAPALRLHLPDAEATEALGAAMAATRPIPAVVHLFGDLGAGKSTLARALLRALGVQGAIRSPTYTLVERYPLQGGGEALHLDLYRIGNAGELEFLGLDGADAALWLVEWPERGGTALPPADLALHLAVTTHGRDAVIEPRTQAGRDWEAALAGFGALRAFSIAD